VPDPVAFSKEISEEYRAIEQELVSFEYLVNSKVEEKVFDTGKTLNEKEIFDLLNAPVYPEEERKGRLKNFQSTN